MADDQTLALIQLAYAAALHSTRWREFLIELSAALRAPCGVLHLQATQAHQHSQVLAAVGVDPAMQQLYDEHYADRNVWIVNAGPRIREGAVLTGEMLCTAQELQRSEYYNDYLKKLDLYHALAAVPAMRDDTTLLVSILASKQRGAFEHDEATLLRRLSPHLQQAARVHALLAQAKFERQAMTETLPFGVVLLDKALHVVFAIRAARKLADQRDGFSLGKDGPSGATRAETTALRTLIATAAGTGHDHARAGGITTLSRPSGSRDLEALVTPLGSDDAAMLGERIALTALFIVDPESAAALSSDALRRLYGLTPSEARIASALAGGASIEDVASKFQLINSSTRWFVKQPLEKTGTHSRSEAVALILRGLASLARRS